MAAAARFQLQNFSTFSRSRICILKDACTVRKSCQCFSNQTRRFLCTELPRVSSRRTVLYGLGPSSNAKGENFMFQYARFLSESSSSDKQTDFNDIKLMLKHKLEADKVESSDIDDKMELLDVLFEHNLQHIDSAAFKKKADEMKPSDLYTLASDIFSLQDKVGQEAAILSGPLFKHAATAGDSNAKYSYAQLLRTGQAGIDRDPKEAATMLSDLAQEGHPFSQFALAGMYYSGVGVSQNFETAYTLYQIAAENGVFQGFNMIGRMYLEGQSVNADHKKAVEYFKKGADEGDVNAYMSMAHCYTQGKGIEKDEKEAFKYHHMAAEKGYAPAIYNVGAHYFSGRGTDLDMKTAAEHFKIAADTGFEYAQVNLANMYYHGLGVEKDWEMARDLYKKAAPTNHSARLLLEELEAEMQKKGTDSETK